MVSVLESMSSASSALPERSQLPSAVLLVALLDLPGDLRQVDVHAFCLEFQVAPFSALCRAGNQVELDVGVGKYDRADVPAVHHHAALPSQFPLQRQEPGAYRRRTWIPRMPSCPFPAYGSGP